MYSILVYISNSSLKILKWHLIFLKFNIWLKSVFVSIDFFFRMGHVVLILLLLNNFGRHPRYFIYSTESLESSLFLWECNEILPIFNDDILEYFLLKYYFIVVCVYFFICLSMSLHLYLFITLLLLFWQWCSLSHSWYQLHFCLLSLLISYPSTFISFTYLT